MTLDELVEAVNRLSDEDEDLEVITGYLNDAIAEINVFCDANFPFFNVNDTSRDYNGFPEKWQRALLIPYAVGRVKQMDSSQFEYSDAYAQFYANLEQFRAKYPIPEEYQDPFAKPKWAQEDFYNNMFAWNR